MQTVKFTHFYDAPTDTKRVSFGGSSGIGKEARRTDLQGKSRGRRSPPGWNGNHRHAEPEARGGVTIKLSEKTGFTLIPVGAEDEEGAREETSSKGVEPLDKQPSNILLISPVLAHGGGAGGGEWSTTQSHNLEKWLKCF